MNVFVTGDDFDEYDFHHYTESVDSVHYGYFALVIIPKKRIGVIRYIRELRCVAKNPQLHCYGFWCTIPSISAFPERKKKETMEEFRIEMITNKEIWTKNEKKRDCLVILCHGEHPNLHGNHSCSLEFRLALLHDDEEGGAPVSMEDVEQEGQDDQDDQDRDIKIGVCHVDLEGSFKYRKMKKIARSLDLHSEDEVNQLGFPALDEEEKRLLVAKDPDAKSSEGAATIAEDAEDLYEPDEDEVCIERKDEKKVPEVRLEPCSDISVIVRCHWLRDWVYKKRPFAFEVEKWKDSVEREDMMLDPLNKNSSGHGKVFVDCCKMM